MTSFNVYKPKSISIRLVQSSNGTYLPSWQVVVEGEFVEGSSRTLRFLNVPILEKRESGGRICPAVEEMIWALVETSGNALVYFDVHFMKVDEVPGVEQLFRSYDIDFIVYQDRTDACFLAHVNRRNQMSAILQIWNGDVDVWPYIYFDIYLSPTLSLDVLDNDVLARCSYEKMATFLKLCRYVISDQTEGAGNEFRISDLDRELAGRAEEIIERIWAFYGTEVNS